MSNDFGDIKERVEASGLFEEVFSFDEKRETYFDELDKYRVNKGNILLNMISRIKYTKKLGELEKPFIPVNLKEYRDIYVFCDHDPIGYYLNRYKIKYHAVEDGLDCIVYLNSAYSDNVPYFKFKKFMSDKLGLIFINDGYGKYCIDMEVNNIAAIVPYCKKFKEVPRTTLVERLTEKDKEILVKIFVRDYEGLMTKINSLDTDKECVLILTEPLCTLDVRQRIFEDLTAKYSAEGNVVIKPHPRDNFDYENHFTDNICIDGSVPMEVLNFIPGVHFRKVVSVFTPLDAISFAKEKEMLGPDFMDKYEDPSKHIQSRERFEKEHKK